jgi:hypothetical protein
MMDLIDHPSSLLGIDVYQNAFSRLQVVLGVDFLTAHSAQPQEEMIVARVVVLLECLTMLWDCERFSVPVSWVVDSDTYQEIDCSQR